MIESSHNNELSSYDLEKHGRIRSSIESIQEDVDKTFEGIKDLINSAEVELLTPNREFLNGVIESYRDLCNAVTDFQKLKVTTESSQLNESFNKVINQEDRFNRAVKLLNNELAKTVSENVVSSDVVTPDGGSVSKNKEKRHKNNNEVSKSEPEVGTESQSVNRASSLSDLGKLAGLNSIVRELTAEEEEQLRIQQAQLVGDKMVIEGDEEVLVQPDLNNGISEQAPEQLPQIDTDSAALTGAEILESEILNDADFSPAIEFPAMMTRVSHETVSDKNEFYKRWQSGDPTLLPTRTEGWEWRLGTIMRDLRTTLFAAGYSREEVGEYFERIIKPWAAAVTEKRSSSESKKNYREESDWILTAMKNALEGRAANFDHGASPSEDVLSPEVVDATTDAAEPTLVPDTREYLPVVVEPVIEQGTPEAKTESALPEVEAPVSTEDVDRSLKRARLTYTEYRDKFLAHGPQNIPELSVGETICSQLDKFQEKDAPTAFNIKSKYLKTLTQVNEVLEHILAQEVYADAKIERAKAREAFVGARDEYYTALRDFYEVRVTRDAVKDARREVRRLTDKAREFFGGSTELPSYLKELKDKHDLLQMEYALKLNSALFARAESNENNNVYNSLQDEGTKKAFAERFIVKSALETRGVRHGVNEAPSKFVKSIKDSAAYFQSHKWQVRSALLLGYTFLGAVTGGVGTAAVAGGRYAIGIAAGAAGGMAGGTLGHAAFKRGVDRAKTNVEETLAAQTDKLSFSNFAAAQEEYGKAYGTLRRKEIIQGTARFVGALAGGFVAGRGTAEAFSDVVSGGGAEVPVSKGKVDTSFLEAEDVVDQPLIKTGVVTVARFGPDGTPIPGVTVRGISLEGSRVASLSDAAIAEADKMVPRAIERIHLSVKDLLEARPNLPKAEVERIVFDKLQAKYGGELWWKEAGITKLSIESMEEIPVKIAAPAAATAVPSESAATRVTPMTAPASEVETPVVPTEATPTTVPSETVKVPVATPVEDTSILTEVGKFHTVAAGETLGGIVKQEYAHLLKDLTPAEQNRVLAELFDRVRADSSLRDSIGLRGDNVDRIYTNQDLRIDRLGDELKTMLEPVADRPRTGALNIETTDKVESVPIARNIPDYREDMYPPIEKRVGTPVPLKTGLSESIATVYNPPRPEVVFTPDGNYFRSPQYQSFLTRNGFSPELVTDATNKFALKFEGETYSAWNEIFQKFDSPYEELKGMTLKELDVIKEQAGDSEEALRTLLAKQAATEAAERGLVISDVPKTFNLQTVRVWDTLIDSIRRNNGFAYNENTTIDDLIKRYVAEQMIKNNYDAQFKATIK